MGGGGRSVGLGGGGRSVALEGGFGSLGLGSTVEVGVLATVDIAVGSVVVVGSTVTWLPSSGCLVGVEVTATKAGCVSVGGRGVAVGVLEGILVIVGTGVLVGTAVGALVGGD